MAWDSIREHRGLVRYLVVYSEGPKRKAEGKPIRIGWVGAGERVIVQWYPNPEEEFFATETGVVQKIQYPDKRSIGKDRMLKVVRDKSDWESAIPMSQISSIINVDETLGAYNPFI